MRRAILIILMAVPTPGQENQVERAALRGRVRSVYTLDFMLTMYDALLHTHHLDGANAVSSALQIAKPTFVETAAQRRQEAAENPDVRIARETTALLNKLTESNFERLYSQLLSCDISTTRQLENLINGIFQKVTSFGKSFLPMYVELCCRLKSHFEKNPIEGASFRRVLVESCQHAFEETFQARPEMDDNLSYDEKYEIESRFKNRMLNNLRFIGELLVRKFLTGKLLLAISEALLSAGDDSSIEAACTLLTVCGMEFDKETWENYPRLNTVFERLHEKSKDKELPKRLLFVIEDLITLRKKGWAGVKMSTFNPAPLQGENQQL